MKNKEVPNLRELKNLEKQLFKNSKNYEDKIINKVKNNFNNSRIKFITRSELLCDYSLQICALIRNNNKIYSDIGHLTDNGARFFFKGDKIMRKFKNSD